MIKQKKIYYAIIDYTFFPYRVRKGKRYTSIKGVTKRWDGSTTGKTVEELQNDQNLLSRLIIRGGRKIGEGEIKVNKVERIKELGETMYPDASFEVCLEVGQRIEDEVHNMIRFRYPKAYRIDGYCKEYDIFIPEKNFGVEVKRDAKSLETGNIVVEIEYGGKPSALSTTKAKYWVFFDTIYYIWMTPEKIKECIRTHKIPLREFKGGSDTLKKKAYLVPKDKLIKYAEKKVKAKETNK